MPPLVTVKTAKTPERWGLTVLTVPAEAAFCDQKAPSPRRASLTLLVARRDMSGTLDLAQARRDRFEERAAILEFDEGLPRAEAEAIAHREMAAGICETVQAERNPNHYASTLAALRAKCPAYVPEDRWRQAIEDATAFVSEWGERAQAFGWTARELFGLHPVPERPAANYSRLSRDDATGLIWLLRGRPVTALTAAEAAMRCHSGATLTHRRQNEPVAKAAETEEAAFDAAEIAKRATA